MKQVDPLVALKAFVAKQPTQEAAAIALKISAPHLVDLMKGRRGFSDAVLERLGLQWTVVKRAS